MNTRIDTKRHGRRQLDRFDHLGAWITAGLFWLGMAIAAIVIVFCGLLVLINIVW